MLILLTISAVLAVLYVGAAIWKRHSIPESISAMVFDLPRKWQWLLVWLVYPLLPYIDGYFYMPGLPMWLLRIKTFVIETLCTIPFFGALFVYYY